MGCAEVANVDAGQDDFFGPGCDGLFRLQHGFCDGGASGASAGEGYGAECAEVIAPVLDLEKGTGPVSARKARHKRAHFFDFARNGPYFFRFLGAFKVLGQVELFTGAENEVDALDLRDFIWLQLGVAADNHHKRAGVALHGSANGIAAFGIGMVCDAAGVDDHHVGRVVQVHPGISRIGEVARQGGRFAEIQLASQRIECCFEP